MYVISFFKVLVFIVENELYLQPLTLKETEMKLVRILLLVSSDHHLLSAMSLFSLQPRNTFTHSLQ